MASLRPVTEAQAATAVGRFLQRHRSAVGAEDGRPAVSAARALLARLREGS